MANHLDELTIHAYRGIHELRLSELGNVNLFVGFNGSGKTSVLESVSLLCNPLDPAAWYATARRRRLGSRQHGAYEPFRWMFPQWPNTDELGTGRIEFSAAGNYPVERVTAEAHEIYGDAPESEDEDDELESSSYSPTDQGAEIQLFTQFRQSDDSTTHSVHESVAFDAWVKKPFRRRASSVPVSLPCETLTPILHYSNQVLTWKFSEARKHGRLPDVVQLLCELEPGLTDIALIEPPGLAPTVHLYHERLGPCPSAIFGDGLRRALLIALTLPGVQDGVLLIDDLEEALHVGALQSVYTWLVRSCKQLNIQLFATTHSLEAVDAVLTAQLDTVDELVAYHLPEPGGGHAKRFAGDLLDNLRFERGLDIR